MLMVKTWIFVLGCSIILFSIIHYSIFIYQNKPRFKGGNIFWNYFRLIISTKRLTNYFVAGTDFSKKYERTVTEDGTLHFLGIWKWALYKKIWCFCDQKKISKNFIIKPK